MDERRVLLSPAVLLAALLATVSTAAAQLQGPFDLPDDPFLCYKAKTVRGDLKVPSGLQVELTDQFESDRTYDVRKPNGVCSAADVDAAGVVDPATHLTSYRIDEAEGEPKHVSVANIRVLNQYTDIVVRTTREDRLLVPATVDALGGPVSAPDNQSHEVDHYKCYKIKPAPGSRKLPATQQASVEDIFESPAKNYDFRKPKLLCNPVDKNGEGIKKPDGHLLCYKAKTTSGQPKHTQLEGVSTADQLVIHQVNTRREDLLCVPSLKNPPAEFCGDGAVNQAPLEDCDGDSTPCAPGDICNELCQCVPQILGTRTFSLDPATSSFISNLTGPIPLASPTGTIELDGGQVDVFGNAPVSLLAPPYIITTDLNIGLPQTICHEILSCTGTVHCTGGTNVDVLETLDSLPVSQPSCIQDGANSCPNDPSSVCCSNACEGVGVGGGNPFSVATGVNPTDSGPGALLLICDMRTIEGLPLGTDCSAQDYSSQTIETHALTTGSATSQVINHCAGTGAPPDVVPTFGTTGVNLDCSDWSSEDGDGTIVWALATEESNAFLPGDGANAFIYDD